MMRIPNVGLTMRLLLLELAALIGVAAPAPAKTHNSKDALWRTERLAEMVDAAPAKVLRYKCFWIFPQHSQDA